jgi:hypothetical protein
MRKTISALIAGAAIGAAGGAYAAGGLASLGLGSAVVFTGSPLYCASTTGHGGTVICWLRQGTSLKPRPGSYDVELLSNGTVGVGHYSPGGWKIVYVH